jgi:small subunit ribosomal protein S13
MARIAGVNLPNDKKVEYSLTYVYGIGFSRSQKIVEKLGIDKTKRMGDLSEEDVNKIRTEVEKNNKVEGDLKREVVGNIKRLKEVSCHRGSRHQKSLPVRGQRTKTNSRTVRGNKKGSAASGKKPSAQKT